MRGSPFDDYLTRGERVLWTGRPAQGLLLMPQDLFLIPFSLLWTSMPAYAVWGMVRDGKFEGPELMLVFFLAIGSYMTVGRFLVDAIARSTTRYAVTDRRALILRGGLFSSFRSIDLDTALDVKLSHRLGGRGTIRFGHTESYFWRGRSYGSWSPAFDAQAQFLAIRDPAKVYALITDR